MAEFGNLTECAKPVYQINEDGDILGGTNREQVQLPNWHYIGGDTFTLDGTNAQPLTVPANATIVELRAESGEVYFAINGLSASATSPGYIPEDQAEIIGPLDNLNSVHIFSATAATVCHYMWFSEA